MYVRFSGVQSIHTSARMSILFENALIFSGEQFIERGFVLVQDGKIARLGEGDLSPQDIPSDTQRISCKGTTLLPGLIDSHVHGLYGNVNVIEESLRFGVTTVMDMHNEPEHIAKLRKVCTFCRLHDRSQRKR